jgi:hypothetical protein
VPLLSLGVLVQNKDAETAAREASGAEVAAGAALDPAGAALREGSLRARLHRAEEEVLLRAAWLGRPSAQAGDIILLTCCEPLRAGDA